jgi:FKBP-type peptidyl-prolyl isomerase-like protein
MCPRSEPGRCQAGPASCYVADVAGTKRDRQRTQRDARRAREAALARARARRQRNVRVGVVVVALAAVAIFVATRGSGSPSVANSPSTTVANAESAAGKPCVPVADPLPAGAPTVPVQVGPPPTQLVSQDLKVGTGASVGANDTVTVNYIGVSCSTGKIFDSSYSRSQPATFPLSGVIKGWTDGIPNMKVGGQRLLGIPPDQGYGADGSPPDIAPDETLWFVVEVLDTKPS